MSKKLIAVAAAAALALTGLVAAPAQASDFTVTVKAGATDSFDARAKAAPATHAAPENNEVVFNDVATGTAVRFTVEGASTTDVVTSISAAGGVRLVENYLDAESKNVALSAGVTALSMKYKTSNNAVFYAYATSTTPGTVTISAGGNTKVYYVASRVGNPYNVSATFPSFVAAGGSGAVKAVITDVFGNAITEANKGSITVDNTAAFVNTDASDLLLTVVGGTVGVDAAAANANTGWKYSTTSKTWGPAATGTTDQKIWVKAGNSGSVAARVDIVDLDATSGKSRDREVGLAAPKSSAFSTLASGDLAAQVTALQAIVDRKVSKKKYNTLARKWNRAFPSQKVALKK
jgi:hypothetical protein